MLNKTIIISLIMLMSCKAQYAQTLTEINYPSTPPAKGTAGIFAPALISTDEFEHSPPTFSRDGKTVLWSIVKLPSWKARILEMNFVDGKWSQPRVAPFSDTTVSCIYPSFQPGTNVVYFSSDKKVGSDNRISKGNVLWRVEKNLTGWSSPEMLDSTISRGGDFAPSLSSNGNIYFTHGPFRSPDWNILVSKNDKSNRTPQALAINSPGYEDGAFISPDESYVIFESNRPGSVDGSLDLYIAFKSKDGSWSTPVNLGDKVNTSSSERFARISPDGKYLFFGSNRREVNGKPNFDIYWIDASFIQTLRADK